MTQTVSDLDILENLDFELACSIIKPSHCQHPARWALTRRCCPRIVFYCDGHRTAFIKHLLGILARDNFIVCGKCRSRCKYDDFQFDRI